MATKPRFRVGATPFLDCPTLPLICTLLGWVLSKEVSSTFLFLFSLLVLLDLGFNPGLLGRWQTLYPQVQWAGIYCNHCKISLSDFVNMRFLSWLSFANGLGDQHSIPGQVIPKTQKMVLDDALLSTQHYKVRIKGKVEQFREWSGALPYTSVWSLLKREPSGHPRLREITLLILLFLEKMWYYGESTAPE